jgi:hypothetical protein
MRRELALGLCIGASLLAAGCDPIAENRLFREGIGSDLSRSDLADATRLQNAYLGYMCQQAGLDAVRDGDAFRCAELSVGSRNWEVVVQAGMNDIDQRCDAYLAWLDDRRRSKAPILSQINAMQTATTAILRLAGTGADSITIVGEAFGVASNTFTNVHSRLLLEVNHSTVQAVVLNRRNEFRFATAKLRIDNRPAAIHVLRSYLNICMPFTIEMAINTTVTAFELSGPGALGRPSKVATAALPLPTIRADQPAPVTPPPTQVLGGAITNVEKRSVSRDDAKAFQRALCVSDTGEFGPETSETRQALRQFFEARYHPAAPPSPTTIANLQDLNSLRSAQSTFPSCPAAGFANAFEVGIFSRPANAEGTVDPMQAVTNIVIAVQKADIPVPDALRGTTFGPSVIAALRGVIPLLRSKYSLPDGRTIDRQLFNRMMREAATR